jgi:fatty acid desaturase
VKEPITGKEQELTVAPSLQEEREMARVHRQTFIREEYPANKKALCDIILLLSIFISIGSAIYLTIYPGSRLLLWYPVIILCMVFVTYYDACKSMSAYKKFRQLYPEEHKLLSVKLKN